VSAARSAALLAVLAALLPACAGEEDEHLAWRRRQELLRAGARWEREVWKRIAAEVQGLPDHPWAGSYRTGDARTIYAITPESGAAFACCTCAGWTAPILGTVVAADDRTIHVEWRDGGLRLPPKLYVVRWGDVRFLVPAEEMAGFCRRIGPMPAPELGPEWKRYPCDTEDLSSCVVLPDLPEPYRSRLGGRLHGG
jgi:hypothetical protein